MRHSTLELTGRYTRTRVDEIRAVSDAIPGLEASVNAVFGKNGADP